MSLQFTENENPNWRSTFFPIWIGQAISLIGSKLVGFALIWYLTDQTNSGTTLAVAAMIQMLPALILGPISGAIADRYNRKKMMIFADSAIAFFTLVLALLFIFDIAQIWHIYALMLARSLFGTFHWPAMSASTSLLVPREKYMKIQGLNQSLQAVLNILAPPLGALVISLMQVQHVLLIDIITAAFAVIPLFFVAIPQPKPAQKTLNGAETFKHLWGDLKEGFQYVTHWKALLLLLICSTCINFLLSPATSLTPLLVKQHFGKGAAELGWVQSALGIGMLAGSLLLTVWGGFKKKMITSWVGLMIVCFGTLFLGLIPTQLFPLAIVFSGMMGFGFPISNGPIAAIIQEKVEPQMQGRVFTLMSTSSGAIAPLGLAIAGPFSDAFGPQTWIIIAGIGLVIVSLVTRLFPTIITIEDQTSPMSAKLNQNQA